MKQAIHCAMAGTLALSACAPEAPLEPVPQPPEGEAKPCQREPGQAFVGQKATTEVGAQLLAATGARNLRWVPPRTAVTMDFRSDRLTVYYDDAMVITQVSCT